jgi:hypothetical protein
MPCRGTDAVYCENQIMWAKDRVKSTTFCDITPCSPLKVNIRFGGTYRLHLQGQTSRARYQRENRCKAVLLEQVGLVSGELSVCGLLEVSVINVMFVLRNKQVTRRLWLETDISFSVLIASVESEMLLVACRQVIQEKEELVWSWERQRNWHVSREQNRSD